MRLEQVDKGIYEAIRKEVVRLGYFPDLRLFPKGKEKELEAAKAVIRDSGKKLIEIKGVASGLNRQTLNYNSIFINRDDIAPGGIGMWGTQSYVKVVEGGQTFYDVYLNPTGTVDIEYQIEFFTDDTTYDRIIQSIIMNALKVRGFIPGILPDYSEGQGFYVHFQTTLNKSDNEVLERAIRYDARDIVLEDGVFLYRTTQVTDIDISSEPVSEPPTEFEQ